MRSIAFGTLALGPEYRALAKLLAHDLWSFNPEHPFIVLTDSPASFAGLPNVRAVQHSFSGVRACYHDKRFVVAEVLKGHDTCVFLDADCRLLERAAVEELAELSAFWIAARGEPLWKKLEIDLNSAKQGFNGPKRRHRMFAALAEDLGVELDRALFLQESFWVINKRRGDLGGFLRTWDYAAAFATARLYEASEGSAVGLALERIGSTPNICGIPHWLFKDLYTDCAAKSRAQAESCDRLRSLRRAISEDFKVKQSRIAKIPKYAYRYSRALAIASKASPGAVTAPKIATA